MPAHKSHGKTYIEPPRHDELPDGVRQPDEIAVRGGDTKRSKGRFQSGDARTKAAAAKGGRNRRGWSKLTHDPTSLALTPELQRQAEDLFEGLSAEFAQTVGGGHVSPTASVLVKFAAQKIVAAQEALDAGAKEEFRKLSESARMDLLYAREMIAKDAKDRVENAKWGRVAPLPAPPRPRREAPLSAEELIGARQTARQLGFELAGDDDETKP